MLSLNLINVVTASCLRSKPCMFQVAVIMTLQVWSLLDPSIESLKNEPGVTIIPHLYCSLV